MKRKYSLGEFYRQQELAYRLEKRRRLAAAQRRERQVMRMIMSRRRIPKEVAQRVLSYMPNPL